MSKSKLIAWYKKRGFVDDPNYIGGLMYVPNKMENKMENRQRLRKFIRREIRNILIESENIISGNDLKSFIKSLDLHDTIKIRNKNRDKWITMNFESAKFNKKGSREYVDMVGNGKRWMFFLDSIEIIPVEVASAGISQERDSLEKEYNELLATYMSHYDEEETPGSTYDWAIDIFNMNRSAVKYLQMTVGEWWHGSGRPKKNDYIERIQWDLENLI